MESNSIKHLAIIMDGNARWARKNFLTITQGHESGVRNVEETVKFCIDNGIKCLTLYAFSTENYKRPKLEIDGLMAAIDKYLEYGVENLLKNNVKINLLGSKNGIKDDLLKKISDIEKQNAGNSRITLNIAFNYGGRQELVDGFKKIAQKIEQKKITSDEIDTNLIADYLYISKMSEPDLVIRTGGEFRISNFLLWHIAYSELFFTDILWPDFNRNDLEGALKEFKLRKRNYGGRRV
ncbi:polyprenyl diphosphate synthase [Flavobacteriaceae bacterium]|nr:polyprenyl diphosphate synthase [Flavobacteriaceae bacterium]